MSQVGVPPRQALPRQQRGQAAERSPQPGLTTVVIVSHCSAVTIETCLRSVLASTAPVDVIVVDNASDDATRALLDEARTVEPCLRTVLNDDNRGFAAACNQGAALASGDALLFLNPDAFVTADTVKRLRALLASRPELGLLGCRVLDERGRAQGPQRRREPTWRRSLMSLTGLSRFERRWPALAGVEVVDSPAGTTGGDLLDVDAVNGAVMLVPRRVFERVGGFDEAFRLHAEDLDLCRRIRDAGFRVAMTPSVAVAHVGGVSSRRRRFRVEWWKTRSLWRYFRKHDPDASKPWIAVLVGAGLVVRYLLRLPVLMIAAARRS